MEFNSPWNKELDNYCVFRTELKNNISLSMLCEILCIFLFSNSDNCTDIYFGYA